MRPAPPPARAAIAVLIALALGGALRAQPATPLGGMPAIVAAPDHPSGGLRLTLEQSVAEALARNFSVRISSYSVDQAKAGVVIAQSVYDPVLGVQWQDLVNKSPDVTAEAVAVGTSGESIIAAYPYSSTQQATISATQNVPTGGQIAVGYNLGRDFSTPASLFLNPAYTGNVSLTVSQPLLQGAGLAYSRAAIELARAGERVARINMKSAVLTMIYNVETAYYDVVFARRQYVVAQDNVRLSRQLLDENRIKRKTGVLTDLDVVQAQAALATARSQLIGYRQSMENAADTLLQAMGERQFKVPVGTLAVPPPPAAAVSFDVAYKLARDNGPSLAVVQATIEEYKLQALRAKREALPQLGVTGGAGRSSMQSSYADALNRTWSGPGYNWQAGLTFSFPWGLRQSRAQYRQAEDSVRAEQTVLEQADQTLVVQIRAAVRAVRSNQEAVVSAGEATRLSEKQYDLQKGKFDAGLATSYDVLQAQYELESARVSQLQAEVNLRLAVADLHFLEGTSLETYRIKL
ncbi:MAG: TolC family protein [Opitutaceae bacterium]